LVARAPEKKQHRSRTLFSRRKKRGRHRFVEGITDSAGLKNAQAIVEVPVSPSRLYRE